MLTNLFHQKKLFLDLVHRDEDKQIEVIFNISLSTETCLVDIYQ